MKYKILGQRTGLRVSEFALGAGNFGTRWGHGAEPADARAMFDRFVEAGGNFIDTADGYQFGQSEELVGQFIGANRDDFVVATKYSNGLDPKSGISRLGNSRKTMVRAVEDSLKRLNTDYIDLYWTHFPDAQTPTEEILRGFDDLVTSGKILHAGLSNFPAWRVSRAVALAELRNQAPIAAVQFEYSLVERAADREYLPMIEGLGLGATMWSPLGGGFLTGKYRTGAGDGASRKSGLGVLVHNESGDQKSAVLDEVIAIAAEVGATPSQVSVAWLRHRGAGSAGAHIPIIGPRTVAQLDDYLAAIQVQLSSEQVERLTAVSDIVLGAPYDQSAAQAGPLFAGQLDRLRRPLNTVA